MLTLITSGDIGSQRDTCSSCERAGVACSGGGETELRIRFSKIGYKQPRRRNPTRNKSYSVVAPPQDSQHVNGGRATASTTDQAIVRDGTHSTCRESGFANQSEESFMAELPTPDTWNRALATLPPAPELSRELRPAIPTLSPGIIVASQLSPGFQTRPGLDNSPVGSEPLARGSPPRHISLIDERSPSLYGASLASFTKSPLYHSESPCLWPLLEEEVKLVKYFFTMLLSWVSCRHQELVPGIN